VATPLSQKERAKQAYLNQCNDVTWVEDPDHLPSGKLEAEFNAEA